MAPLGRLLILLGLVVLVLGVAMVLGPKIPFLGKLPGDFVLRKDGTTIYLPLATSIVLSVVLTLLLNLFWR